MPKAKTITFRMKNTKNKLNNQSKFAWDHLQALP